MSNVFLKTPISNVLSTDTTLNSYQSGAQLPIALNGDGNFTITLPVPASGLRFKFIVSAVAGTVANNRNATIAVNTGTITGFYFAGATQNVSAVNSFTLTGNDGTSYLVNVGDWVELVCLDDSTWTLSGGSGSQTPMRMQIGEIFFNNLAVPYNTGALVQNTATEIAPALSSAVSSASSFDVQGNRLRYKGTRTTLFHCAFSIASAPVVGNNTVWYFELRKNGAVVPGAQFIQYLSAPADVQSIAMHKVISLATNDTLSVYVTNTSSTSGMLFYNYNLVAVGDCDC